MRGAALRVLVIEDHVALSRFIAAALTFGGLTVTGSVGDQALALVAIRQDSFDIAVLDWTLRGEEAVAIIDALHGRGIPFLLISGHALSHLPQHLREVPFLQKPFTASTLLEAIAAIASE